MVHHPVCVEGRKEQCNISFLETFMLKHCFVLCVALSTTGNRMRMLIFARCCEAGLRDNNYYWQDQSQSATAG